MGATANLLDLISSTNQCSAKFFRQVCLSSSPKSPPAPVFLDIPSPPVSPCPTPFFFAYSMDCEDDNWSFAVSIESCPTLSAVSIHPLPVAVDLGSDSSTTSNRVYRSGFFTSPTLSIDVAEASSLSTSVNGFQLDNRTFTTTKSVVATSWVLTRRN